MVQGKKGAPKGNNGMKLFAAGVALIGMLGLGACTTSPLSPSSSRPEGAEAAPSFTQFSDVPIPAKATMDVDHSLLLGHGDTWVGRLIYSTGSSGSAVYDLYKSDMPGFGWQEITSVRASTSVQTWQRADRVATVQIKDTTFGAEVILTIAPAVAGGAGSAPPPPSAAPSPKVSRQPIH
jgi:hypothetical protein